MVNPRVEWVAPLKSLEKPVNRSCDLFKLVIKFVDNELRMPFGTAAKNCATNTVLPTSTRNGLSRVASLASLDKGLCCVSGHTRRPSGCSLYYSAALNRFATNAFSFTMPAL